ncbi:hypothetical protein HK105_202115 [Polyrhizophydium stewartii]|uniref:G-protein coupled receptors family 3 profile domain-containing protein n=1 Tax=Polyrhizophydium stewartii TaxID=2732419 RepID=A0ABR4NF99_9FUNG
MPERQRRGARPAQQPRVSWPQSRILAALLVVAAMASAACAARSTNKTQSRILIPIVGDGYKFVADQSLLGVRMAIQEINNRTDILQDVTLVPMRVDLVTSTLAKLYDSSVSLCDTPGVRAMVGQMPSKSSMALSLVCPNPALIKLASDFSLDFQTLHSSAYASASQLSNKKIYPLYFRYVSSFAQMILGTVAQFKYFGWTNVGLISAQSGIYPTVVPTFLDIFPSHGISVLASVTFPDYKASISTMYYPQIRQPFEFLRQSGLRIFFVAAAANQIVDVMLAANQTGLIGRDYYWATIQNAITVDPALALRWETTPDPMVLRGVSLIQNLQGPFFDDPFYLSWKPRFDSYVAHTLAYEKNLYRDMNPSQTDPTKQDYPASFFFDDPGSNQYPAFYTLGGYDGMWAVARALERAIANSGRDGAALANGSIAQYVKLSDVIDIVATTNTLIGVTNLTANGDASPDPLILSQFTGESFGMDSVNNVAVFEFNDTTGESTVGDRAFLDFPIDYPPANNDYVNLTSPLAIVLIVLCLLASIMCLLCSAFYLAYSQDQKIKPRAPFNLAITGVGLSLIPLNVFTLIGMDKPMACAFRPWPVPLGLTVMLVCIIVKNAQLYAIFKTTPKSRLSPIRRIGSLQLLLIVVAVTTIVSLPIVAITARQSIFSDSDYIDTSSTYLWVCGITTQGNALLGIVIAMIAVLACTALFFGYANKELPELFNDSKAGAGAAALSVLFSAMALAQGASSTSTRTQFVVEGFACILGVAVISWILLGSHIWQHYSLMAIERKKQMKKKRHHRNSQGSDGRTSAAGSGRPSTTSMLGHKSSTTSGSSSSCIDAKVHIADPEAAEEIKQQRTVVASNACILQDGIFPQWRRIMIVLFPDPVFIIKIVPKHDNETPKYLSLRTLKNMYHNDKISNRGLPICFMEFAEARVTLQFSSTAKVEHVIVMLSSLRASDAHRRQMRAWIDTVGRTTLRQRANLNNQTLSPNSVQIELPPPGQMIQELRSGKRK